MDKKWLSTSEVAPLLGISRVAVFKRIKSGQIKAQKVGRNFVIPKTSLPSFLGKTISEDSKRLIDRAIQKTIREYGETLKLLGKA